MRKPKRGGSRHANFLCTSSGRRPRPPPSELGVFFPDPHLVVPCRAPRCRLRAPQAVRARRFPDLVTAPPVSVLLALSLPNCIALGHFLGNAAQHFPSDPWWKFGTSCGRSYGGRAFSVRAALAIRRSPACRAPISWLLGFPFPVCRQVFLLINSEVVMVRILSLY